MKFAVLAFIATFLLTGSVGTLVFYRYSALRRRRLMQAVSPKSETTPLLSAAAMRGAMEKLVGYFQTILPRSKEDISTIQKRLGRAGLRGEFCANFFYGSKILAPCALCLLATATRVYSYNPMFIYTLAIGIGILAPDFWLGHRITARQTALRLGLPDALDLIVICVEAGLSLDKATLRTAEELRISQPAMAEELNLVSLELRAGSPRAEVWRRIGERTDVEAVRNLATILIQADKFGTSIGKALRIHSEGLRITRRQDAEEKAAKTAAKLVFPLVLFIFPSLFAVTLGPSAIAMMNGFKQLFG